MSIEKLRELWVQTEPWLYSAETAPDGRVVHWIVDEEGFSITEPIFGNVPEHELIVEMRRHLPQLLKAVEALELARSLVDEAMTAHIYNDDEEPDEDCSYAAFLRHADEILEGLK